MNDYLFDSYEALMAQKNPTPENIKKLIFELDLYINEKINSANDLKYLSDRRHSMAKQAAVFRDHLKEKLSAAETEKS